MRKTLTISLAAALAAAMLAPAAADPKMKTLGTDPANDGPPALDITSLQVGRNGAAIEIRIGINAMLPVIGGYPELPGIEWVFETGGRTFIAEAVAGRTPSFYLFELTGDSFTQLESPTGTYDWADGYASILVPMSEIGAAKGSVLKGVTLDGAEGDVDGHVHAGPQTYYSDFLQTTKSYKVR